MPSGEIQRARERESEVRIWVRVDLNYVTV